MLKGKIVNTLEKEDILKLLDLCNEKDQTKIQINLIRDNDQITDYLYYENDSLIGYLVIYPGVKLYEAVSIGFVHPLHRRNGIFTELLEHAKTKLIKENKHKITFIVDSTSTSGIKFMEHVNAKYSITSVNMIHRSESDCENLSDCEVIEPTLENMNDIIKIGMEAFETTEEEERLLAIQNIKNPNRKLIGAKVEDQLVGIVAIIKENDSAIIGDLAVLKAYRNQGIGSRLLLESVKSLLKEKIINIQLNVYADNKNALSLYQKSGFEIARSFDHYELMISY